MHKMLSVDHVQSTHPETEADLQVVRICLDMEEGDAERVANGDELAGKELLEHIQEGLRNPPVRP